MEYTFDKEIALDSLQKIKAIRNWYGCRIPNTWRGYPSNDSCRGEDYHRFNVVGQPIYVSANLWAERKIKWYFIRYFLRFFGVSGFFSIFAPWTLAHASVEVPVRHRGNINKRLLCSEYFWIYHIQKSSKTERISCRRLCVKHGRDLSGFAGLW